MTEQEKQSRITELEAALKIKQSELEESAKISKMLTESSLPAGHVAKAFELNDDNNTHIESVTKAIERGITFLKSSDALTINWSDVAREMDSEL